MTPWHSLAAQGMYVEAQAKQISVWSQEPHPGPRFWDFSIPLGLLLCVTLPSEKQMDWGSALQCSWTSGTARGCMEEIFLPS